MTDDHKPINWFWEAGSDSCPHGSEPDYDTDPEAWDDWNERHTGSSEDVRICLDAPAGQACEPCSNEHGDMVPWSRCENRTHSRPRRGKTRQHRPTVADVGTLECLERECEEFYTDDGEEITDKTACSHMTQIEVCDACSPEPSAQVEFPIVVAWADCQHVKAGAVQR